MRQGWWRVRPVCKRGSVGGFGLASVSQLFGGSSAMAAVSQPLRAGVFGGSSASHHGAGGADSRCCRSYSRTCSGVHGVGPPGGGNGHGCGVMLCGPLACLARLGGGPRSGHAAFRPPVGCGLSGWLLPLGRACWRVRIGDRRLYRRLRCASLLGFLVWCPLGECSGFGAMLAASVAKCGAVALFVGGPPLGWLAAFVAVCARLGVLTSFHALTFSGCIKRPFK